MAGSTDGDINATFSAPDHDFDYLAAGENLTITYTLQVDDRAGGDDSQTVTVTITGSDDSPVITSGPETTSLGELANHTNSATRDQKTGVLNFADVDLADTHTFASSLVSSTLSTAGEIIPAWIANDLANALSIVPHDFTGTATGTINWSFALPDSDVQFLARGEKLTLTYDVTVTDPSNVTATQTVTVTGTNDLPIVTPLVVAGDISEDFMAPATPSEIVNGGFETGDLGGWTATGPHALADNTAIDGSFSVRLNATPGSPESLYHGVATTPGQQYLVQFALAESPADATNNFTVTWDGSQVLLTLVDSLTPGVKEYRFVVNDDPVNATSRLQFDFQDDGTGWLLDDVSVKPFPIQQVASGVIDFTAADLSDAPSISVAFKSTDLDSGLGPQIGTITANVIQDTTHSGVNGVVDWTFAVSNNDANFQGLGAEDTANEVFTVTVADNHGGQTSQDVTLTLHGKNDPPVFDQSATIGGTFNELPNITGSNATVTASGSLGFTVIDLDDVGYTATILGEMSSGLAVGLPPDLATLENLLTLGPVSKNSGSSTGSVAYTFLTPDDVFDYLPEGSTLTLTYQVEVTDPFGANNALTLVPPKGFAGSFALTVDASTDTATLSDGPHTSTADTIKTFNITVSDANDVTLSNPSKIVVADGGSLVYTVFDGPSPVNGAVAIDVVAQQTGGLYFSAVGTGNAGPDLFTLDANENFTEIPVGRDSAATFGSDAGEDGGYITFAGNLYFFADNPAVPTGSGPALFRLGADNISTPVLDGSGQAIGGPNQFDAHFTIFDGCVYFVGEGAAGFDLFKVDPTGAVTEFDINPGHDAFDQNLDNGLFQFDGKLYFSAYTDGTHTANELFALDQNGQLSHFDVSSAGEDGGFVAFDGGMFFNAFSTTFGEDVLFKIDANGNPTEVLDGNNQPLTHLSQEASNFQIFNGSLYFNELGSTTATGLYKLDASGTATEVNDGGKFFDFTLANQQGLGGLADFGEHLYFSAQEPTDSDPLLYEMDGNGAINQVQGTGAFALSFAGEGGGFIQFDGHLYFFAFDPALGSDTLFALDSSGHAAAVVDPANSSGFPYFGLAQSGDAHFTVSGGDLYFEAVTAEGDELVSIDSTGTPHVVNINADTPSLTRDSLPGADQAAINAATSGDTIWVLPGNYTESAIPTGLAPDAGGLFIDKPNLTLQGVEADGTLTTTAAQAESDGAVIIAGSQTDFGSNHFIGPDGDNTVIQGLHLQAGSQTDNKLLEIWANNVTVENSFTDVNVGGITYSGAAAIYFNDNGTPFTDETGSFTVANNILNEGIIVANGVGIPGSLNTDQLITDNDNTFQGSFDISTGLGRYDTVVLNGHLPGIGWLLESTRIPTIIGNQLGDNTTPFLLRGSDISAANLPNLKEIQDFIGANGNLDTTTYAYVETPGGQLELALRNPGPDQYYSFAVTDTVDTLELALEQAGGNTIFPDQRSYLQSGDTVAIQSGPNALSSSIDADNPYVMPDVDSAHLTLTLATQLADAEPVTVKSLTLLDYASGQGGNVNVIGNDLGDTIQSDHGTHTITTRSGDDTITGGGGTEVVNNASGSAETFNINAIDASHLGIHIEAGSNVAVAATVANSSGGPPDVSGLRGSIRNQTLRRSTDRHGNH